MTKKFEELSIQEQKIKIVEDAIKQIELYKFVPETGSYITILDDEPVNETNIKKILDKKAVKCECCAKGALFASCVMTVNEVYMSDNYKEESFQKKKLSKWFSAAELDLIETAFEGEVIKDTTGILQDDDGGRNTDLALSAIDFYDNYLIDFHSGDRERLLAILNNILENGYFEPF